MIDQSAISQGDALRAVIAAKMAAYEELNGPVETSPILTDDKRVPFRLSCPEKKAQMTAREIQERSRAKANAHVASIGAANRERILALSKCGLTTKAVAERTGLSINVVKRAFKEFRDEKQPPPSTA